MKKDEWKGFEFRTEDMQNNINMEMREDTSEKLISFSKIWLVLSIAFSIITGLLGVIALITTGDMGVLLFAIVLGIVSYLAYLMLLGYAELVQNTRHIYKTNQAILEYLKSLKEEK